MMPRNLNDIVLYVHEFGFGTENCAAILEEKNSLWGLGTE
jgi:hypothetical protein